MTKYIVIERITSAGGSDSQVWNIYVNRRDLVVRSDAKASVPSSDLPADVRAALAAWLASGDPETSQSPDVPAYGTPPTPLLPARPTRGGAISPGLTLDEMNRLAGLRAVRPVGDVVRLNSDGTRPFGQNRWVVPARGRTSRALDRFIGDFTDSLNRLF